MTIKPVLVPDHNAADLRALMDHFATAAQSATPAAQANRIRQQLTESAEPGMAEGSGMYGDEEVSWEKGGRRAPTGAFRNPAVVKTNKSIGTRVSDIGPGGKEYNVKTDKEWDKQKGVAEARPDVMRHRGDTTIRVVKKGGVPIGEIGTDSEASPGNGDYYVKLYDGSYDAVGYDTAEEALAELKAAIKQGVAEGADGNWYIRVNGKILNDTKSKPVIFSSEDEARSHAMKLADKKRIPLSQIKLTKSWMDAPEQGVAEGVTESIDPVEQLRADILRFAR